MAEAEWENQMDYYEPEGPEYDPDEDYNPYDGSRPCWTLDSSPFSITTIALIPGSKKMDLFSYIHVSLEKIIQELEKQETSLACSNPKGQPSSLFMDVLPFNFDSDSEEPDKQLDSVIMRNAKNKLENDGHLRMDPKFPFIEVIDKGVGNLYDELISIITSSPCFLGDEFAGILQNPIETKGRITPNGVMVFNELNSSAIPPFNSEISKDLYNNGFHIKSADNGCINAFEERRLLHLQELANQRRELSDECLNLERRVQVKLNELEKEQDRIKCLRLQIKQIKSRMDDCF